MSVTARKIKAAGLARGALQFFRAAEDPAVQAALLLQKIGTLREGDLPPALDLEVADGQTPATIVARIQTWAAVVQAAIGRPPIILVTARYWNSLLVDPSNVPGSPLWIAQFGGSCPNVPAGWQDWAFWFYGESYVPGISLPVHRDAFNGTLTDLNELSIVPFADFRALLEIDENSFAMKGYFSLGIANHEIDPIQQPLTLQVGSWLVAVPAGSFRKTANGRFGFQGQIGGERLKVEFSPARNGGFFYRVEAEGVNLSAEPPVSVTLTLGNQRGTTIPDFQ